VLWRATQISGYCFPSHLHTPVGAAYPYLDAEQQHSVIEGLREYFQICNIAGKSLIAMPSQAVDRARHEFILSTRAYESF